MVIRLWLRKVPIEDPEATNNGLELCHPLAFSEQEYFRRLTNNKIKPGHLTHCRKCEQQYPGVKEI